MQQQHYYFAQTDEKAPAAEPERPFLVEESRRDEKQGRFVPEARLVLTPKLRTGGLLRSLSDSEARALLAVLALFSPQQGRVRATVPEAAAALGLPERQARERLERLARAGKDRPPVLVRVPREIGPDVYALSPGLISYEQREPQALPAPSRYMAAGRAAVIAHSRMTYARPRAEAEQEVLRQLGHTPQEDEGTPHPELVSRLVSFGVPRETALELVARYPADEVKRQMDWIGLRSVRSPSRFLVAAIRGRYDPPPGAKQADAGTVPPQSPEEEAGAAVSLPIPEAVDAAAMAGEGGPDA